MSRETRLVEYMREHRNLTEERKPLIEAFNKAHSALTKHNKKIKRVGNAIYDLKHDGDTPEVTDHAIVRYLERVEKLDINDLKVKVANHSQAKRQGNVIVTVNEDLDDVL